MRRFYKGLDRSDWGRGALYVGASDTVPRGFVLPHSHISLSRGPLNDVWNNAQFGIHLNFHNVLTVKLHMEGYEHASYP